MQKFEFFEVLTVALIVNLILVLGVKYLVPKKTAVLALIAIGLAIPFLYLGFYKMAMYNQMYIWAGMQWGFFGGTAYAITQAINSSKGSNA